MLLALDFDDTYNKAPSFWDDFIASAADYGHKVIMATYRHPTLDYDNLMDDIGIEIYFTDGKAKKPFLEAQGVIPDIWIDDRPKTVYEDSAWGVDSPELHAWREANKTRV